MSVSRREMNSELSLLTTREAEVPVLMLSTSRAAHASRSGYSLLAEYIPGSEVLTAERRPPTDILGRVARFGLSRAAITSWYQLASASLEWRAWQRIRGGFEGVVHVLWADSDLGVLDYLVRPAKQALCCTFHSSPDDLRKLIRFPDRLLNLRRIVLMSSSQVQYFLDCGVSEECICVIPHGVDTAYFHPAARPETAKFTVLSVGSYKRNFPLLLEVCRRLKDNRDVEFRIVTAPSFHPLFENLPNVTCEANLTDEELLNAYQFASCYLMTAEDATANNALLESMSCGLPVIAEGVGGITEYTTRDCALITPPQKAEQIAEGILALQDCTRLREQMGGAARRRAIELDWKYIANLTRDMYAQAVPR